MIRDGISGAVLADLYAAEGFYLVRLSPEAWRLFRQFSYEEDGSKKLWGRRVEVTELPEGIWAETDNGTQLRAE